MPHKPEPVAEMLDHVLLALDIAAGLACDPNTIDEVIEVEARLGEIIKSAKTILKFIDKQKPLTEQMN